MLAAHCRLEAGYPGGGTDAVEESGLCEIRWRAYRANYLESLGRSAASSVAQPITQQTHCARSSKAYQATLGIWPYQGQAEPFWTCFFNSPTAEGHGQ